jgi:GNAT superfamily N-acetyltransferase
MPMLPNILPLIRFAEAQREALASHFLELGSEDRRLRFGNPIGEAAIRAYVERIDFTHDAVFGSHDFSGRVLAAIHVPVTGERAELGLSVLERYRGLGLGNALFSRAVMHLRNRGVRSVFVHCLAENEVTMHLALKHGMRIVNAGVERQGHADLDPATAESRLIEWLDDSYASGVESIRRETARFSRAVLGLPL